MNDKISVFGSFVVDLMGRAHHLPVPGETIMGSAFKMGPGGKGSNQAIAAGRAGGDTTFITKLGRDIFGRIAVDFYESEGLSTDYLFTHESEPTGTALILVDENTSENSILVNSGACGHITKADLNKAEGVLSDSRILLTQLEINLDILPAALEIFRKTGGTAILNPAPAQKIDDSLLSSFDIITPNEVEASILSGIEVADFVSAEEAADVFISKGVKNVIITMGSLGVFIKQAGGLTKSHIIPAFSVDAVDSTGAGDAFNGGFAAALAKGYSIKDAAVFGSATAALSVTKIGTAPAMPGLDEVTAFLSL